MQRNIEVPSKFLHVLNQIFEIEQKLGKIQEPNSIQRNIDKLKENCQSLFNLSFENPLGEKYNETRTDCEANIAGESTDNLVVVEVIKPIIRYKDDDGISLIVQKAVVIVSGETFQ